MNNISPYPTEATWGLLDKQRLNVLLVDSGARGHALAWKLLQSDLLGELIVAPGNGGTATEDGPISNEPISPTDIDGLVALGKRKKIDLVIPTMDNSLAEGAVDAFTEAGIPAFGPTKEAATIEWSKAWAKDMMKELGIPTAVYEVFSDLDAAHAYVKANQVYPIVVKEDGLALGKGVTICNSAAEAHEAISRAPGSVVIEEFLEGPEITLHALCGLDESGQPVYKMFPAAQDHKPIFDGDKGPNTGGIGAVAPVPWFDQQWVEQAGLLVVKPALEYMAAKGYPFSGLLFPGLKITPKGLRVLEYNARPGDPETQVYMRLLKSDLLKHIVAAMTGKLGGQTIEWRPEYAACVVICAPGYPGEAQKGLPINGLRKAKELLGAEIFHAGTAVAEDGSLHNTGGRILSATGSATWERGALDTAYAAVDDIEIPGSHHRTDIGKRKAPNYPWLRVRPPHISS